MKLSARRAILKQWEQMVVYKHLGEEEIWARPKKMFLEKVVVAGKKVPRFKYIGRR